jgi:hypothetical protein
LTLRQFCNTLIYDDFILGRSVELMDIYDFENYFEDKGGKSFNSLEKEALLMILTKENFKEAIVLEQLIIILSELGVTM